ncbi:MULTISPECIES: cysteine peptidase family C39 domain-containing protein [Aerosakkonema]|uniref:cysteine peptidase family C39 domain-containing protein n=1 Tax=Aerosakkonema TaxID=1246629 RepID=UPI0035B8BA21
MVLEIIITLLLGSLLFRLGMGFGRVLLRNGATANDLFKGKSWLSLAFLGFYFALLILTLNVPQMQILPLEWRFYGMQVSWTLLRVILLGICGMAFTVSWYTARSQIIAVVLLAILGLGAFTSAEAYFLAPIYGSLQDNLQPNGVFKQTSTSSCAPAALATLLRRWGLDTTESSVARLAGTSRMGTSMPQLILAAQALGMDGIELGPTWEQMQQINRPGVLAVWLFSGVRKLPHAVALLALSSDSATIADPARGKIFKLDRTLFAKVWRHQYVPIFRPQDIYLTPPQAADYLHRLGYLQTAQSFGDLKKAILSFQKAEGLKANGELDPQTVLLLSGAFLQGVPTLSN